MDIIPIPGANMNLAEHQDEYLTMPVRAETITVVVRDDGAVDDVPCLSSAWKPTRDELALLLDGGYVQLRILGTQHPPVMITVEASPEQLAIANADVEDDWPGHNGPTDREPRDDQDWGTHSPPLPDGS